MTLGEFIKKYRDEHFLSMETFAKKAGVSKSYISMLEKNRNPNNGKPITPSLTVIKSVAGATNTDVNDLLDLLDDNQEFTIDAISNLESTYPNLTRPKTKKVPLLGEIACGNPIFADEKYDYSINVGIDSDIDFCLKCKGDSMINARILDGDIVFIHQQNMVDNGEIAAVIIGNEATLKRVNYNPDKNILVLKAENPKYEDFVYIGEELEDIKILGKAVAFQSYIK